MKGGKEFDYAFVSEFRVRKYVGKAPIVRTSALKVRDFVRSLEVREIHSATGEEYA